MQHIQITTPPRGGQRGFTLVELMVAMGLGLILTLAMSSVYLFTKSAFSRQEQLSSLQQNVRRSEERRVGKECRV